MPTPPRLHWGWVLALTVITFGMFSNVWLLVEANWIRRARGKSNGFWFAIAGVIWLPASFVLAFAAGLAANMAPSDATAGLLPMVVTISRIGAFAIYVATVFVMRSEMQAEPIGISLGPVLTFIWGVFYFQYHLQDYAGPYTAGSSLSLFHAPSANMTVPAYLAPPVNYPSESSVAGVIPPIE